MTYGATREEAINNIEKLAIEVIADRIQYGELPPSALNVSFLILREHLAGDPGTRRGQYKLRWRTERGRLLRGVPLDDRNVLFDVMGGP